MVASTAVLGHEMGGGPAAPINTQVPIGTLWPESNGSDQNWSPVNGTANSTLRFTAQGAQLTHL